MANNRRSFLKLTAALGGGLLLNQVSAYDAAANFGKKKIQFGLQLYTLRDDMAKDARGTLKKVADFGYKQIESFDGPKGMFFGMSNKEFKRYMDELGMTIISSHCNIYQDFERKADEASAIGMKYLICPNYGAQKSIDGFKKAAEVFNDRGDICKKAGLRFAYHNHEYSFKMLDGQMPQDVMMQNTNKDTVDYEMDIYWVVTAGEDPMEWIRKYPDRFKLFHMKDRKKDAAPETRAAFTTLGTGKIDLLSVAKLAMKNGKPYFFVEQDQADIPAIDAAQQNAEYLKNTIMPKL